MSQATEQKTPAEPGKRRRRWYQFGISSLLLLTLAVAIFCAWAVQERRAQQRKAAALKQIVDWGGHYEARTKYWPWVDKLLDIKCLEVSTISFDPPPKSYDSGPQNFDKDLRWLEEFPELETLSLGRGRTVVAGGFDRIANLKRLKKLTVRLLLTPDQAHRLNELAHVQDIGLTTNVGQLSAENYPGLRGLTDLNITCPMPGEPIEVRGFPALGQVIVGGFNHVPSITIADLPQLGGFAMMQQDWHSLGPFYTHGCDKLLLQGLPKMSNAGLDGAFGAIALDGAPALQTLNINNTIYASESERSPAPNMRMRDCGALQSIYARNVEFSPEDFAPLANVQRLELRNCSPPPLSPEQWKKLVRLELSQSIPTVVDAGAPCVDVAAMFSGIESLDRLQVFSLTDAGKVCWPTTLPRLPSLGKFVLQAGELDQPLELREMPCLARVELDVNGHWSSIVMEDLPLLSELEFDSTEGAVDKLLLRRLPALDNLAVHSARCRELIVEDLPQLTQLFVDDRSTHLGAAVFRGLPLLEQLRLSPGTLRAFTAEDLPGLKHLIVLPTNRATGAAKEQPDHRTQVRLQNMPNVEQLTLRDCDVAPDCWPQMGQPLLVDLTNCTEPMLTRMQWAGLEKLVLYQSDFSWRTMIGAMLSPKVDVHVVRRIQIQRIHVPSSRAVQKS